MRGLWALCVVAGCGDSLLQAQTGDETGSSTSATSTSTSAGASSAGTSDGSTQGATTNAPPACGDGMPNPAMLCLRLDATYPVGDDPRSLALGDINEDDQLDLVVGHDSDNVIWVLTGDGAGGLTPAFTVSSGDRARGIAVVDVNGDALDDMVATDNNSNQVWTFINIAGAEFMPGQPVFLGSQPTGIATADLDGNARRDIAIAYGQDNQVGIHILTTLTTPTGSIYAGTENRPVAVVANDIDGDGSADLVSVNQNGDSVTSMLGMDAFSVPISSTGPLAPNDGALLHTDTDMNLDLALTTGEDRLVLLAGDGLGGFTQSGDLALDAASEPQGIVAADFDDDGRDDLAVVLSALDQVTLFIRQDDGFAIGPRYDVGDTMDAQGPHAIVAGDLNGDAIPDIVVSNRDGDSVTVLLSNP